MTESPSDGWFPQVRGANIGYGVGIGGDGMTVGVGMTLDTTAGPQRAAFPVDHAEKFALDILATAAEARRQNGMPPREESQ